MGKVASKQKTKQGLYEEYNTLLERFNKAFNFKYEEGSKADIEFRKIIKRLAELETMIKKV